VPTVPERPPSAGADNGAPEVTICSVVFGDKWCLDLNRDLTRRLNPGRDAHWRLVRNRPHQPQDKFDPGDLYEVIDGVELPEELRELHNARSHHHAAALALASIDIGTRFVLFLDADCFVTRPGWLAEVTEHMLAQELAFFGVPYHPRQPSKLRYFPCAVWLMVDTARVDVASFDWTPGSGEAPPRAGTSDRVWRALLSGESNRHRLRVESSTDTGSSVYRRYRSEQAVRSECVVPVLTVGHLRVRDRHPRQILLEKLLPDRYCAIPRRDDYFTDAGFAAHGLPDMSAMGCEEYMWRGDPFALHLRGGPPELRGDPSALAELLDRLERLPVGSAPPSEMTA
jgi:hypothetical protein